MKIATLLTAQILEINMPLLISLGIIIPIVLAVSYYFLYQYYLKPSKKKRMIKEVERRYQYYHSLLNGQCLQIISRLEIISHSNLVYATYHTQFLKRYRDIVDTKDKNIEDIIFGLNDFLTNPKKANFKSEHKRISGIVDEYAKMVDDLNDSLMKIMKQEEESRAAALKIKEYSVQTRKKYFSKNSEFQIAIPTFDKIFDKIDKKFILFETFIDSANYDSANALLKPIEEVCDTLNVIIDKLPAIDVAAENTLPERLSSIELKYENCENLDIPLYHISSKNNFEEMRLKVDEIKENVKNLKVDLANKEITKMSNVLDDIDQKIDSEIEAKKIFEDRFNIVYKRANSYEEVLVKLYNDIPKIKAIYVLDGVHANSEKELNDTADNLAMSKRKLESSIHCTNKQPFSLIVEKLNELEKQTDELQNKIELFNAYALSLKNDCNIAHSLLTNTYQPLKKLEVIFSDIGVECIEKERINTLFNRCHDALNEIAVILKTKPIDVVEVDKKVLEFKNKYQNLTTSINTLLQNRDKCIMLFSSLNKFRDETKSMDDSLNEAEKHFNNYMYEDALSILEVLSDKHIDAESEK